MQQLLAIFNEVEPRWLATSLEWLDTAVELVLTGHRPAGLLVFDYHPEVDAEREIFEAAQAKLAAAGLPDLLVTLASDVRARREASARTAVRGARDATSACAPSTTPRAAPACPRARCIRSDGEADLARGRRRSRSSTCTTCR